jgi:hypothetical protein
MADPEIARDAAKSPVAAASGSGSDSDVAGYFDAYAAFARTLRTWLVGFGVGVPVVIASQADLAKSLRDSGNASWVVALYLGGVAVQIAATLLYKTCMWYSYLGADEATFRSTRRYRMSTTIADLYWLEFTIDLVTIGLFCAATFVLLQIVL